MDDISSILQRIPQFASAKSPEIKELSGGITNKNYKITVDDGSYVLRLGGNETKYLGIDRKIEYECSLLASQIGIAPEPTAFLEPEGYIVARFISGKGITAEEIGTEENIKRVCSCFLDIEWKTKRIVFGPTVIFKIVFLFLKHGIWVATCKGIGNE